MLAEMYGMMPSANTVARESWPPTNRSYRPSSPPPALVLEEVAERDDVDARRRDVRADAVDQPGTEA